MTREQLIAKRKLKKTRRAAGAAALAAACGIALILVPGSPLSIRRPARPPVVSEQPAVEESLPSPADETPTEAQVPAVESGWREDSGGRYYIGIEGNRLNGWFTDSDGSKYLFGDDGYVKTGWQEPDIGIVYFSPSGALTTGVSEIDGKKYYFGYDGVMLTGWRDDGDLTYYFDNETGAAMTGWQVINGEDCYFNEDGVYDPEAKKTPDGPAVALTFDDGPGEYTNAILDVLVDNDAKATFFMLGTEVRSYPSAVKREYELGMEQGNHSWDHKTLTRLDPESIRKELSDTNDIIESVTGAVPTLFRPPGGGYNSTVIENSFGMPMIMWSIDTLDWKTKNADQTYNTVMNNVKDGDIILMHEIYSQTLDAVRRMVPALKERGFRLVTVSELAAEKGVTLTSGYSYGNII